MSHRNHRPHSPTRRPPPRAHTSVVPPSESLYFQGSHLLSKPLSSLLFPPSLSLISLTSLHSPSEFSTTARERLGCRLLLASWSAPPSAIRPLMIPLLSLMQAVFSTFRVGDRSCPRPCPSMSGAGGGGAPPVLSALFVQMLPSLPRLREQCFSP